MFFPDTDDALDVGKDCHGVIAGGCNEWVARGLVDENDASREQGTGGFDVELLELDAASLPLALLLCALTLLLGLLPFVDDLGVVGEDGAAEVRDGEDYGRGRDDAEVLAWKAGHGCSSSLRGAANAHARGERRVTIKGIDCGSAPLMKLSAKTLMTMTLV